MNEEIFSLLGVDPKSAKEKAFTRGLLSTIFNAAALSGPQARPVGNAQALGQLGLGAIEAYDTSIDRTLKEIMTAQQMKDLRTKRDRETAQQTALSNLAATLPEDQRALAEAFPEQFATQKFREPPGVVGEFQAAKASGLIPEGTTLTQYIASKRPPGTTVNVGGGSKGQEKVDEKYADDYVQWTMGGGQDAAAQLAQLMPVINALEKGEPITGVPVAVQPDLLLALTNPQALQSREQVEEVVQRNLRVILGAQFTEKEGERLIARAFNPKLPPEENAKRLRRLFLQMSSAAEQKNAAAAYFEQNGTLRGFKGKTPSVQDFYNAMEGGAATVSGSSISDMQAEARRLLDQRRGGR
jgi:hypothetical protein